MTTADYERALARLLNWMIALAIIGTIAVERRLGLSGAGGFLIGAVGAWLNLRLIERGVNRVIGLAAAEPGKIQAGSGVRIFVQFTVFVALAFVIIDFTGFNMIAALLGFLVCPAAAVIEIVYELFTYGHS